ncbi:MAG: oxidoreductase [archaeon]
MYNINKRLKVGFFGLTSCAGCHLSFVFIEDELLKFFEALDIQHFRMIGKKKLKGKFDLAFVEGAVVSKEDLQTVLDVRKRSKKVVALGTCATYGGVPAIKNYGHSEEAHVHDKNNLEVGVYGIGHYIDVDYYLRGCPPESSEIVKVTKELLVGQDIRRNVDFPVCKECRERGNECLLQKGQYCMGPITYGGCHARCPSVGVQCLGCRGPLEDSNIEAAMELYEKNGYTKDDVKRMFIKFASTSRIYWTDEVKKWLEK